MRTHNHPSIVIVQDVITWAVWFAASVAARGYSMSDQNVVLITGISSSVGQPEPEA